MTCSFMSIVCSVWKIMDISESNQFFLMTTNLFIGNDFFLWDYAIYSSNNLLNSQL